MDLKTVFASASTSFNAELELLRGALSHAGQKGAVAEGAVKQWLSEILPTRLGVSEGIICSSDGYISPQLDIVIYDKAECPVIFSRSATKIIPIEFVYAVFEVKTHLTGQGFREWSEKTKLIKSTEKHFSRPEYTYHAYGSEWKFPPILSGIFALTGDNPLTLWDLYVNDYRNNPQNLCIDICYINGSGLFTQSNEKTGLQALTGSINKLVFVKEDPLVAFWTIISILSTQWKMLDRPAMYRYSVVHNNSTTAQLPFLPPQHSGLKGT